ncbi:MAG: hypothetical protein DID92_2727744016 [Candidatus Nitrotoga sp. SPKER]|nr:MAG: hypothetical protein DID92_2727744016 [Candidatus Nitrotoga sp. SPKER]
MRVWRALKASGATVLRDGVYLMPDRISCNNTLEAIATEVRTGEGTALVLRIEEPNDANFVHLFDRSEDFAVLLSDVVKVHDVLFANDAQALLKQARKLRKTFISLAEIDFFPGEAQKQTDAALQDLELEIARALAPDEPHSVQGAITRLRVADYQGRIWATRRRPWVDRLASAWLIRRFIDPQAQLLWVASLADCPDNALGFDFDGATFSHVNNRVTFEVLMVSFDLNYPALKRLGVLVHYLDVGGVQPPEAAGVESVLIGLRETILDDNQLLASVSGIFDGLLIAFGKEVSTHEPT